MQLFPGEPPAGPWRVEPTTTARARARPSVGRPIVAVDGRSAGGRTTWERADLVLSGTPTEMDGPGRLVVADP